MRFEALATDYDGTIAHDGVVDRADARRADARARRPGCRLIMVTGRELSDLFNTFAHSRAVRPDRGGERRGALRPGDAGGRRCMARRAAARAGRAAHGTRTFRFRSAMRSSPRSSRYEHQVLSAIHDLGLEWHVIFNKGSVMALPADVTKASGLAPALAALGLRAERTDRRRRRRERSGVPAARAAWRSRSPTRCRR